MNSIDRRRKERWDITLWATENSVIVQISLPEEDGGRNESGPLVDVACRDFQSAVSFARSVCRLKPHTVDAAAALVFNWAETGPETFLALASDPQRQRH